ncbi:MAG: SGNH/GDSL hydrolase family protein [Clostridia bacterium]|nr:SGNH/GDSL hydrolase family protein [Clostridia bacterium]
MKTFLFQGDSITDADRRREDINNFGYGYPNIVASKYMSENPNEYTFINKGISGNRIVDLYARIKCDIINLKPDYMSILIGINDVWHELSVENGVDNEKFKKILSMLIEEVKEALPEIKIIMLEPFVLKGPATEEKWTEFRSETELRAKSVKEVAEKYNLSFVPLQDKFDELSKVAKPTYWLIDGVHPSAAGHEIIAKALSEEFEKISR